MADIMSTAQQILSADTCTGETCERLAISSELLIRTRDTVKTSKIAIDHSRQHLSSNLGSGSSPVQDSRP